MSTTTAVLALTKPAVTEDVDITVLNTDFDIIDAAIGAKTVKVSSTVVANTAAEAVVSTLTIPANAPAVGSTYKLVVSGQASTTLTPTLTFRLRLGGLAGTLICTPPAITTASGIANKGWRAEAEVILVATPGAGATWQGTLRVENEMNTVAPNTMVMSATATPVAKASDVSTDMVITVQWSAASASNTLSAVAGYGRRITNA